VTRQRRGPQGHAADRRPPGSLSRADARDLGDARAEQKRHEHSPVGQHRAESRGRSERHEANNGLGPWRGRGAHEQPIVEAIRADDEDLKLGTERFFDLLREAPSVRSVDELRVRWATYRQ